MRMSGMCASAWVMVATVLASGACAESSEAEFRLAQDRGCFICHAVASSPPGTHEILPSAPSFQDIARRYHGDAAATPQVAAVIRQGSGRSARERHWAGKAAFAQMFPNASEVTEDEAQRLARWILTRDGR